MDNNVVFKSILSIFNLDEPKVVEIYNLLEVQVTEDKVKSWNKNHLDSAFAAIKDVEFSTFLNALICEKRGKKEGPQPQPEQIMNNNIIFKKLKIALNLKNEDIANILNSVNVSVNSYELTSFFRKHDHKNYRSIKDSLLRDFLKALELKNLS